MTQKRSIKAPPAPESAPSVDLAALVRLGLWGSGATAALLLVALATGTDTGHRRLAQAYATLGGQPQVASAPSPQGASGRERELETETRRLGESLRNLAEDRDRLLARMTALERNYEDVTGSIGRLTSVAKPPAEPATLAPVTPPAETPAAAVMTPAPAGRGTPPAVTPADPAEAVSVRTEFGVDLGGGPTVASLRTAWNQIRRNHAVLLDGLRPLVAVRDGRNNQAELRLVIGPLTNAAAAAKLCAALAGAGLSCQPTTFDGQRLALR